MSGIEIVGLAASVIQLAETGLKLSVKLYTFTRKIKSADKAIDALSNDIATTGAVLQQLGATLSENEKLCSPEAIKTARKLLDDCKAVFTRLDKKIDLEDATSKKSKVSFRMRLGFTFLESEVAALQANLERLKSSLLVILNVLILAEQYRGRETIPVLRDQQQLLKSLLQENTINEKRYNELQKRIQNIDSSSATSTKVSTVLVNADLQPQPFATSNTSQLPPGIENSRERILDHGRLVTELLREISEPHYQISYKLRMGLHDGILDIHWNTWSKLRQLYGDEDIMKLLAEFGIVHQYWMDRKWLPGSDSSDETFVSSRFRQRRLSSYRSKKLSGSGASKIDTSQTAKPNEDEKSNDSDQDMGFGLFDDYPSHISTGPQEPISTVTEAESSKDQNSGNEVLLDEVDLQLELGGGFEKDLTYGKADEKGVTELSAEREEVRMELRDELLREELSQDVPRPRRISFDSDEDEIDPERHVTFEPEKLQGSDVQTFSDEDTNTNGGERTGTPNPSPPIDKQQDFYGMNDQDILNLLPYALAPRPPEDSDVDVRELLLRFSTLTAAEVDSRVT